MSEPLQRARSLLDAARLLKTGCHDENAANRAYYAMFHAMQDALRATGIDPRGAKSHSGVKRLFDQHIIRPGLMGRDMSVIVQRASEMRWQADYGEPEPTATLPVADLLEDAERCLDACSLYLTRPR